MLPHLVINATSLFFHNRRFETPATKKNITNQVEEWVQRIPPPPFKKQKTTATGSSRSVSSNVNPNPTVKTATSATTSTTKSTSSTIVVASTTEALRKKPAPGTKRRAKVLESASDGDDEGAFSNLCYEGLGEDEDDALEQADAVSSPVKAPVAAQMSKRTLNIRRGIIPPVQVTRTKRQGNKQLPNGALDNGRWTVTFVPTFLQYVGATNDDVWTLKLHDTITALQAIWNGIYKGSAQDGREKIKHRVEKHCAVYDVSTQRVTDWRSSIGSNGLAVVGDFMDSLQRDTTEARKEAAEQLLEERRYVYLKTRDATEGGKPVVKKGGRYRGPLVVQTMAQCWFDFEGAIEISGFVEYDDFPCAALVLSATSVHRALWLWANGYITKESHDSAKLTKGSGILKVMSQNGKVTKKTNFSKDQWDEISDMHMREILVIGPEKLRVIRGDIQTSAEVLCRRKSVKKCKEESEENRSDEKARGSGYQHRVVSSDSDV